jgi:hypothetical protein
MCVGVGVKSSFLQTGVHDDELSDEAVKLVCFAVTFSLLHIEFMRMLHKGITNAGTNSIVHMRHSSRFRAYAVRGVIACLPIALVFCDMHKPSSLYTSLFTITLVDLLMDSFTSEGAIEHEHQHSNTHP